MKKKKELPVPSSAAEYLTYIASTGDSPESFEMRYENENIWLTQKMMSSLYGVDVRTINDHIQKIYDDGELTKEATIRNFRIVQTEGTRQVQRNVMHYPFECPRMIRLSWQLSCRRGCRTGCRWMDSCERRH